jgi:transposase
VTVFQKHDLSALIEAKPKEAAERIMVALRQAKAHKADAAKRLGCSHQTLLRWIAKLGIGAQVDKLIARAEREGWHHGRTGGRPQGSGDKIPRKRRGAKAAA